MDGPLKPLLNRWVVALATTGLLGLKMFWVDIREHMGESFQGPSILDEGQTGLTEHEMATVTGFKLVPARNNPDQVHTEHVQVVARQGSTRTLAFTLSSTSPDNDYPNLRVTLSRRDGTQPRIVEFGPSQYGHGRALSHERVELLVEVRDGESRAVIEPFYRTGT